MSPGREKLVITMTMLGGWLPVLALCILSGLSLFSSMDISSGHPWHGAGLVMLFVAELLLLWALTSVAFGLKLHFFWRFVLLCLGVITLSVLTAFALSQWWQTPAAKTQGWMSVAGLIWLFILPWLVCVLHALAHYRILRSLLRQQTKKAA